MVAYDRFVFMIAPVLNNALTITAASPADGVRRIEPIAGTSPFEDLLVSLTIIAASPDGGTARPYANAAAPPVDRPQPCVVIHCPDTLHDKHRPRSCAFDRQRWPDGPPVAQRRFAYGLAVPPSGDAAMIVSETSKVLERRSPGNWLDAPERRPRVMPP